jgi:hypothetical protein
MPIPIILRTSPTEYCKRKWSDSGIISI